MLHFKHILYMELTSLNQQAGPLTPIGTGNDSNVVENPRLQQCHLPD